jgi:hypothetical protein
MLRTTGTTKFIMNGPERAVASSYRPAPAAAATARPGATTDQPLGG